MLRNTQLALPQPVSVTWLATCFPQRTLTRQLDLYTIRRLQDLESPDHK